jgi:hypothetical protein
MKYRVLFFIFSILFFTTEVFSNKTNSYKSTDFFGTVIDWTDLQITLPIVEKLPRVIIDNTDIDYGKDGTAFNISEARNKAQQKAREKISLQIVRSIENIRLDENYTMLNMIQTNAFFRERINEYFRNERSELKVAFIKDKVFVDSVVKLKGKDGLLNFLVKEYETEQFPELNNDLVNSVAYSGLIIDARHLDAEPSLFPRIVTDKGLDIYSHHFVYKNHAIDNGLVSFQMDPKIAMAHPRVGKNPYYVLALSVVGNKRTEFSIHTEDAKKILGNQETKNNLKKCNVIILLPRKQ